VDEIAFLAKLTGGSVINLDIMRLPGDGDFTEEEYQPLYLFAVTEKISITSWM
jgi:hypothetical protein